MGQALVSANVCAQCGEALTYSVKTGQPCPPKSPDGHYHEKKPVYSNGTVPICCKCGEKASGEPCKMLEANQ